MAGIRSIEDIRARCVMDDITGCWCWKGGLTGRKSENSTGIPSARCSLLSVDGEGKGKATSVCSILFFLMHGKPIPHGKAMRRTCETKLCVNPAHRKLSKCGGSTKNEHLRVLRTTKTMRARSRFSEEAIEDVRSSTDTLHACAARHGMHPSYVSLIRRGAARRAVLAPSIFNLGG
jgi:hypothetical protein